MVNLIADGITFSFGVFFPHLLEYFGESKGKTAWIAGIFMAMPMLSGPIASSLTDRYGCRLMTVCGSILATIGFLISSFVDSMEMLFLTFGIMAGFGLSLCYVAAYVIVTYYFEKKRSLAIGISVCGSGIGTFLFAPLTNWLLEHYGWRGTVLIQAGFFLNMAVCGLLFRDLPSTAIMNEEREKERKRSKRHGSKEKEVWCAGLRDFWELTLDLLDFSHFLSPAFLLFSLSNFLLYMWYDVPYVYVADHAMTLGFTERQGAVLISVIGIFNMLGQLVLGWMGDWRRVDASLLYALCMVLCGLAVLALPLLGSLGAKAAAAGAFGLFVAANYSLTSIILVEQITLEKFTNAYGLLLLIQGIANLVGPPIAGWVYDVTNSYELSFYLAGAGIATSGAMLLAPPTARCRLRTGRHHRHHKELFI